MFTKQWYLNIFNYKCEPNEQEALQEIEDYIINKYNVSIYKLVIYDYGNDAYGFYILVNRNDELIKMEEPNEGRAISLGDENKIYSILRKHKINKRNHQKNERLVIHTFSFESFAVEMSYNDSFYEYKEFRERIFNDKTMHHIDGHNLIVYYKNQECLDEAVANGETEYLKNEYYKILKKYDRFNMISQDKHFFTMFDIASNEMHPLACHDMVAEYLFYN